MRVYIMYIAVNVQFFSCNNKNRWTHFKWTAFEGTKVSIILICLFIYFIYYNLDMAYIHFKSSQLFDTFRISFWQRCVFNS